MLIVFSGLLASYLISEAYKWHPLLLSTVCHRRDYFEHLPNRHIKILSNNKFTSRQGETGAGITLEGGKRDILRTCDKYDCNLYHSS